MIIDWTQPVELDDGTPVTVYSARNRQAYLNVPKSPYRETYAGHRDPDWDKPGRWSYVSYADTEPICFGGLSPKQAYTVRNSDLSHTFIPEDWS